MLNSIVNFIKEKKYKILGVFSFGVAVYFAHQYFKEEGETDISDFIKAIKQEKIH